MSHPRFHAMRLKRQKSAKRHNDGQRPALHDRLAACRHCGKSWKLGSVTVYRHTVVAITGEIDNEWAKSMPRRMVLVREAGGPGPRLKGAL